MAADPLWDTCQRMPDRPCRGVQTPDSDACLAHLTPAELELFLTGLSPGAVVDARGTVLSGHLLERLVDVVRDGDQHPVFARLWCDEATFQDAKFNGVRFTEAASFSGAHFLGVANFIGVRFGGDAWFDAARFDGDVVFSGNAHFDGYTNFSRAQFAEQSSFAGAWFGGECWFSETQFRGTAVFTKARFGSTVIFGPILAKTLSLGGVQFTETVDIQVDANAVICDGARFEEGVNLIVRYGTIAASWTVFGGLSSIASPVALLQEVWPKEPEWFGDLSGGSERPVVLGLHGTDVSNLVLVDVDLSRCGFTSAHRLDQLRIEGRCTFGTPPAGWQWTKRQVLAEEAHWRNWPLESQGPSRARPERLAAVYRSLRKAFEDSKYEAGAGDFYYGEMEMRRHSTETRRAERLILWFYWLLSGYGQRGGRALTALLVLITTVGTLLAIYGQPAGEAAKIAVGAVVLREAGTELTIAGEWTVMAARFLGPVLLALAVLAVRARVKR